MSCRPRARLFCNVLAMVSDKRDVEAVSGTKQVSALMQQGSAQELRIVVLPIVLGQGGRSSRGCAVNSHYIYSMPRPTAISW